MYKNFTVLDDYKKILLENYFTEVKSVERPSYDDDETYTENPTDAPETSQPQKMRIKRFAKRFLGIDLENSSKSEVSGLSANRLYSGGLTSKLVPLWYVVAREHAKQTFLLVRKFISDDSLQWVVLQGTVENSVPV